MAEAKRATMVTQAAARSPEQALADMRALRLTRAAAALRENGAVAKFEERLSAFIAGEAGITEVSSAFGQPLGAYRTLVEVAQAVMHADSAALEDSTARKLVSRVTQETREDFEISMRRIATAMQMLKDYASGRGVRHSQEVRLTLAAFLQDTMKRLRGLEEYWSKTLETVPDATAREQGRDRL